MPKMDTIRAGLGLSTRKEHLLAARDALGMAQTQLASSQADLAIVISSPEFAHSGTLNAIKNALGPTPLVGASSRAVISAHGVDQHGLAVALVKFPEAAFCHAACVQDIKNKSGMDAGEELGEKLLRGFKGFQKDFGFVLSDVPAEMNSGIIAGPLIGASLFDHLRVAGLTVYFEQYPLKNAVAGTLFGGKARLGLGVAHGWRPLGKPRLATKSQDNILYEINDLSASTLYEEYFACPLARLKKDLARISTYYPIGIQLGDKGKYLLRGVVSLEDNGSLIFQNPIPEQSSIRLMISTKESCLQATEEAALEAKNNLAGQEAKLVLVFNSVSRSIVLDEDINKEAKIIQDAFSPGVPCIGLMSYGEQSPIISVDYRGKVYFLDHSIVVAAIG
jgi:hypothetical protein